MFAACSTLPILNIFMDTIIAKTLLWCSLQSLSYDFFFSSYCSLTMPYLCKYFGLCCLKRGYILERHQNYGLTFSFNFSCAKQYIITSVQNSSGSVTSNAILWVGFFPFKKNLCKTGSVCVSMGTHLIGEVHMIVKKELSCSIVFMV